ncbi:MAG: isoprenylcysteine carboxylmethyltransferase family protein [Caulobacteraceae bacterium]
MTPLEAIYIAWIAWALSWFAAAVWADRAKVRPRFDVTILSRLLAMAGFLLLFGVRGHHGAASDLPGRLWITPLAAGWALFGLTVGSFVFCWWARLHLGRLWSGLITLKPDHRIVDTGPYGIVRHPIYTGIIAAAIWLGLLEGSAFSLTGAALVAVGFWITARREETFLRQQLGAAAYDDYRRRVPALIPFGPH